MKWRGPLVPLLAVAIAMGTSCGSVGSKSGDAGTRTDSGAAGGSAGTAGTSGAAGQGGSGIDGGAAGSVGAAGDDGGAAGTAPLATGIVLRGGITPLASPPGTGTIRLVNQRLGVRSGPVCTGSVCLSGGIAP